MLAISDNNSGEGESMIEQSLQHEAAGIRLELRDLEVIIQRLRHEQRFYRRLGFDQEYQEMQAVEYYDRKREIEDRLRRIALRQRRSRSKGQKPASFSTFFIQPYLFAVGIQSLFLRRGRREQAVATEPHSPILTSAAR